MPHNNDFPVGEEIQKKDHETSSQMTTTDSDSLRGFSISPPLPCKKLFGAASLEDFAHGT